MMSANINLAVFAYLFAAFAIGVILGFAFRAKQVAKSQKRILELETEMIDNHAEILRLHKVHANKARNAESVPVINLKVTEKPLIGLQSKAKG